MTELICIVCPKGCHLSVDEGKDYRVMGAGCVRGEDYGKKEITNPTRVLTSTVRIEGAVHPCCPVKTADAIPKDCIGEAMDLLKNVRLRSPVSIGDAVIRDICGTGIDWVVTKDF